MAHPGIIETGVEYGILTLDPETGSYHADTRHRSFDTWKVEEPIPWGDFRSEILWGAGCPYIPLTPGLEKKNNEAVECFDLWLTRATPEEYISTGIELGIITQDIESGFFHTDVNHSSFREWILDHNDLPWSDIKTEVVYGSGCPYK